MQSSVEAILFFFNFGSQKFKKPLIMKKLLLVVSIVSAAFTNLNAQCSPDVSLPAPNYADSVFGAWPDTITNFPGAIVSVAYSTVLDFKVPTNAADVDPALTGTILDFTVDAVNGLPPGMTYACNVGTCFYVGGSNGCALISGTCATAGIYDVTVDVTGTLEIIPGVEFPIPYTFTGYKIIVGYLGLVEAVINPIGIHPNPASDMITLSGLNEQMKISSIVITNMEGKVVKDLALTSATSMDVNLNGFDNGVYFVVVNHAGGNQTLKFIKE